MRIRGAIAGRLPRSQFDVADKAEVCTKSASTPSPRLRIPCAASCCFPSCPFARPALLSSSNEAAHGPLIRLNRRSSINRRRRPDYLPRDEASRPRHDRDEYQERRVDVVIERAYRDLLERAPDPKGREHYRQLIHQGCTEEQMRARIRESVEYRVTLPDAKTTRAYRNVFGREPDPSGLESYRRKIVDKSWTEKDVENDLRRSAECRNRRK
jgi:hypothetical protein